MLKTICAVGIALGTAGLTGCAVTNQVHADLDYGDVAVQGVSFDTLGVGILTPSAPTGKESDKQALGDALGAALTEALPSARIMPLPQMLSAINESGLARVYADMLEEYENTGILERERLTQIGEAGGVRYLVKFNLGDFEQSSDKRLSIAGIRMFDTWRATIRVHLEVWDAVTGEIAWQGNEELVFAHEGVKERPVSFAQVARLAANDLVDKVGQSGQASSDTTPETLAAAPPREETL